MQKANLPPPDPEWRPTRREKLEMAWRHRSRIEKNLLRLNFFLIFALTCFIITVVVLDLTYKKKIRDLEDEIDRLKTTPVPDSTTDTSKTTATSITTDDPSSTSTSTAKATTTTSSSPDSTSSTTGSTTDTIPDSSSSFLEALQSIMHNLTGLASLSKTVEDERTDGGIKSRTRGTFLILADVDHQRSIAGQQQPRTNDKTDNTLYIDTTLPPVATEESPQTFTTLADSEDEDYSEGSGSKPSEAPGSR